MLVHPCQLLPPLKKLLHPLSQVMFSVYQEIWPRCRNKSYMDMALIASMLQETNYQENVEMGPKFRIL